MIRRVLLLALTIAMVLSALPAGAAGKESGCRDVISGGGSFAPTDGGIPDVLDLYSDGVYDGGTLVFSFKLAEAACEKVTYRVDVHEQQVSEGQEPAKLATFTLPASGTDTFLLTEEIAEAASACVSVVVTTLSKGQVADRAPDGGFPDVCEDGGGGQGWN